jgi:DNA-binding MarR family transcriptional regulator
LFEIKQVWSVIASRASVNNFLESTIPVTKSRPEPSEDLIEELDLGALSDFVGYHLRVAQVAAYREFEARLTGLGMAPRYFGLLMLLEANPGAPQSRLAEAIHLDRSSLVPILDKLEQEGLLERRASKGDRRLKSVWLTRNGEKLLSKLKPLALEHETRLVAGFTAKERKQLLELLNRVRDNLRDPALGVKG